MDPAEESDDDMVVVVVAEDGTDDCTITGALATPLNEFDLKAMLENATGTEFITEIKTEPLDEDEYCEYEYDFEYLQNNVNDTDYAPSDAQSTSELSDEEKDTKKKPKKNISKKIKKHHKMSVCPDPKNSYIAKLYRERPDLRKDKEKCIKYLANVMKDTKPPPTPDYAFTLEDEQYICNTCFSCFDLEPVCQRHYQEKHGPRYLKCYACGVDFRSTTNLYKHEKKCRAPHITRVLESRAYFLGRKGRNRPYLNHSVPFLNYNYTSRVDPSKGGRPYSCQYCSAILNSKVSLLSHESNHSFERPFVCDQCPRAYTHHFALQKHQRTHLKPEFQCDHCGREFKTKYSLQVHFNTHLSIKRFGCDECEKRYATKAALKLHVHLRHRNLPPPCACDICPKRFPRMWLLKKHMKDDHGMILMTRSMFLKTLPDLAQPEVEAARIVYKSESKHIKVEDV